MPFRNFFALYFALSFGFVVVILLTLPAHAAPRPTCAPRDVVLERLASAYGETRRSIGMNAENIVVEVFASDATGSWTITVTTPEGTTCLVATGHAYEPTQEPLPHPSEADA